MMIPQLDRYALQLAQHAALQVKDRRNPAAVARAAAFAYHFTLANQHQTSLGVAYPTIRDLDQALAAARTKGLL